MESRLDDATRSYCLDILFGGTEGMVSELSLRTLAEMCTGKSLSNMEDQMTRQAVGARLYRYRSQLGASSTSGMLVKLLTGTLDPVWILDSLRTSRVPHHIAFNILKIIQGEAYDRALIRSYMKVERFKNRYHMLYRLFCDTPSDDVRTIMNDLKYGVTT